MVVTNTLLTEAKTQALDIFDNALSMRFGIEGEEVTFAETNGTLLYEQLIDSRTKDVSAGTYDIKSHVPLYTAEGDTLNIVDLKETVFGSGQTFGAALFGTDVLVANDSEEVHVTVRVKVTVENG